MTLSPGSAVRYTEPEIDHVAAFRLVKVVCLMRLLHFRSLPILAFSGLAFLVVGTTLFWAPDARAYYHYYTQPERVVAAELKGLACGSHLRWSGSIDRIPAGTRVTFVNNLDPVSLPWSVPVKIAAADTSQAEALAESPPIKPGESWSYVFWRPGRYFVTSGNEMQSLAGLGIWVTVEP